MFVGSSSSLQFFQEVHYLMRHALDVIWASLFTGFVVVIVVVFFEYTGHIHSRFL